MPHTFLNYPNCLLSELTYIRNANPCNVSFYSLLCVVQPHYQTADITFSFINQHFVEHYTKYNGQSLHFTLFLHSKTLSILRWSNVWKASTLKAKSQLAWSWIYVWFQGWMPNLENKMCDISVKTEDYSLFDKMFLQSTHFKCGVHCKCRQ